MVYRDSLLVTLVKLVDRLLMPLLATKRGKARPTFYSNGLFLAGATPVNRVDTFFWPVRSRPGQSLR